MLPSRDPDRARTAEVVAALCLATDLGMGLPFEQGLRSAVVAMRVAERLGVDKATARQTYFGSLLFYAGCTADAEVQAILFPETALLDHWAPVMFGSSREASVGILTALAAGEGAWPKRAVRAAGRLPRAVIGYRRHVTALCEVTELIAAGFGLPTEVTGMFRDLTERWDGDGPLGRSRASELPMALRIIHVARDAVFQADLRDNAHSVEILGRRAGKAFDPDVVEVVLENPNEILEQPESSVWDVVLDSEPGSSRLLQGAQVDDALLSAGAFADLVSPDFTGHSRAVGELAGSAAAIAGYSASASAAVRRAGYVHDLGRIGVPFAVWQRPGKVDADGWERIRLHAYQTDRLLSQSPFLASLGSVAGCHHERLDDSGYHRGLPAAGLGMLARLLAAADAYRTKIEPRRHRAALTPSEAAAHVRAEAAAGRLDLDGVAAVLEAAGHRLGDVHRRDRLTARERQTLTLLARGRATKQIGRALGVTPKTADHYVQRVYGKIGVSTRAAAAVYAMQHGFATWENSHS